MASFLEQAIAERHIRKIQSALGSYIMSDPTDRRKEIANALSKIEQLGIQIWQQHDGRELEADPAKWTKDYFTTLQSQLTSNFSKERFERTLQVGRYVYRDELTKPALEPVRTPPEIRQQPYQSKRNSSGKLIVAGLVVVAAVATIYLVMKNQ